MMKTLPPWHFPIERAGRSDWPSGVEKYSPWLQPRELEHHEIWFIWRGQGTIQKNDTNYDVRQGNIFWFQPGNRYSVRQDPQQPLGTSYVVFEIQNRQKRPVKRIDHPLPNLIEEVDAALGESITRRIVELLWESYIDDYSQKGNSTEASARPFFTNEDEMTRTNPFAPIPIRITAPERLGKHPAPSCAQQLFTGLVSEILHVAERQKLEAISGLEKYQRKAITAVAMRMQENPKSIDSINTIASEVGYSTDHFTRTFKKIMGCSPQQFLVNSRIAKARILLIDSDLSVKEMADQLGYCNAYFFSRQFKTMTGKTPTEYRSEHSA